MSNERLLQQSVEFTEIVDSEMEQISGGDKPYSSGYDNYGGRGGYDNYGGYGGYDNYGGYGKGKGKGYY
jgi:hypothetical protein